MEEEKTRLERRGREERGGGERDKRWDGKTRGGKGGEGKG